MSTVAAVYAFLSTWIAAHWELTIALFAALAVDTTAGHAGKWPSYSLPHRLWQAFSLVARWILRRPRAVRLSPEEAARMQLAAERADFRIQLEKAAEKIDELETEIRHKEKELKRKYTQIVEAGVAKYLGPAPLPPEVPALLDVLVVKLAKFRRWLDEVDEVVRPVQKLMLPNAPDETPLPEAVPAVVDEPQP